MRKAFIFPFFIPARVLKSFFAFSRLCGFPKRPGDLPEQNKSVRFFQKIGTDSRFAPLYAGGQYFFLSYLPVLPCLPEPYEYP